MSKKKLGKRILAVMMVLCMFCDVLPSTTVVKAAEESATSDTELSLDAPVTEKTLTDNGDGTYTLSLSVTGASQSSIESSKADVIIIIDTSGSMDDRITSTTYTENATGRYGLVDGEYVTLYRRNGNRYSQLNNDNYSGTVYTSSGQGWDATYAEYTGTRYSASTTTTTRMNAAKEAAINLIDTLIGEESTQDIQVSVISFSTHVNSNESWTDDADTAESYVNSLTADGGTNWEAALSAAYNKASLDGREDATRYVIFISDGLPTFRDSSMGYTRDWNGTYRCYGTGNSDPYGYNYAAAEAQAELIEESGAILYTINAFGDAEQLADLVGGTDSGYYFVASDEASLEEAFAAITSQITSNITYTNVSIQDEMTNLTASTVVDGDVDSFTYTMTTASGETTTWAEAPEASFANGTVTWDLGDTVLEDGVTYTVSFRVWPSQDAYDLVASLQNGDISYDDLTDEQKAQIIEQDGGYYLNTNGAASVTYSEIITSSDSDEPEVTEPETVTIPNPDPIPVTSAQITIEKVWDDELESDAYQSESVTLTVLQDGEEYTTVTLSADNEWKATVYVSPGLKTTDGSTVEILEDGHVYTVVEADSGVYELTTESIQPMINNGTLEYGDGNDSTLTATNLKKGELEITKVVTYAEGTESTGKTFTVVVTIKDADGNAYTSDTGITYIVENSDGTTAVSETAFASGMEIELTEDQTIRILHIPSDSQYTVEETDIPTGYERNTSGDSNTIGTIEANERTSVVIGNKYSITPLDSSPTGEGQITITKELNGRDPEAGEFSFTLSTANGTRIETVTNAADGTVSFSTITFTEPGTYTYIVQEVEGDDDSITYDTTQYEITATVTDNGNGTLSVEWTYGETNELTITNEIEPIEITVTKEWSDSDDQDGKRPDSITVELYKNGEATGQTITLSESNSWTGSFTDLDEYTDGTKNSYTVEETTELPEGYTSVTTGNATDGYTITNSYTPETTEVSVTKVWSDSDNQDGKRPESITINLLANGNVFDSVTLYAKDFSDSEDWTYTFTGLDKYDDGNEIKYTVEEDTSTLPEGYSSSVSGNATDGYTITNSYTPETTSVTVTKLWDDEDDQDGKRLESITVNLLADGTVYDTATVTEAEDGTWTVTFSNLPKYSNGNEINYTVSEVAVTDYSTTYEYGDGTVTITNSYTPGKTSVSVTKAWDDADNQDGKRPESITVELYKNGEATGQTITLSESNSWAGSFTELDEYENGIKIDYTIEEVEVEGYETEISGNAEEGYVITNSYTPETITISGTKTWDDNDDQDGLRPDSITINLLADGEVVATTTASEATSWAYSFEALAKYENGAEIEYTIEEEAVAGYTTTIDGYDITNTHTPNTVEVSVTKVWDDGDDQDGKRPTSITINLYADGELVDYAAVTEADDWTVTFTDLPKYEDGEEIEYTITENYIDEYESVISGDVENGFTVTNSYTPETLDIEITKVFDESDKDGAAHDSVTITLYANGVSTGRTITLSDNNNWYGTFSGLAKYEDGVEIEYTIKESNNEDYISVVSGNADSGYTITTYTNSSSSSSANGTTSSSAATDDETDTTEDTTSKTTEITTSGSEDGSVSTTSVDGETENSSFKWYIPAAGVGVATILGVAIFLKKRKEEEEVTE